MTCRRFAIVQKFIFSTDQSKFEEYKTVFAKFMPTTGHPVGVYRRDRSIIMNPMLRFFFFSFARAGELFVGFKNVRCKTINYKSYRQYSLS